MKHTSSLFQNVYCTNESCPHNGEPFALLTHQRCPKCNEPAQLPTDYTPTIQSQYEGLDRYFKPSLYTHTRNYTAALRAFETYLGTSQLYQNDEISRWTQSPNLYLKYETMLPTGSFKERGSLTAVLFHMASLAHKEKNLTLGTVSTGNMAISTVWTVQKIQDLLGGAFHLNSFVVVSDSITDKKLQLIQKAAGTKGTTIFKVKGNYAHIHDIVYAACRQFRQKNKYVFAELTDDIFRIIGYATIFTEIVDQLLKLHTQPDVIVVPVASGGLFRVAVWTVEALYKQKLITRIPKIVLVQEKGADPIVQAYSDGKKSSAHISLASNLVAQAIDVSNSRSGTASLATLYKGHHICISVNSTDIRAAQKILVSCDIFVEEAGAVSVAAVRTLMKKRILSKSAVVVALLSGKLPIKRDLFQIPLRNTSTIVSCSTKTLEKALLQTL